MSGGIEPPNIHAYPGTYCQISEKIQFMLINFEIQTIFRIPFGMEGLITLGKDVSDRFEKVVWYTN